MRCETSFITALLFTLASTGCASGHHIRLDAPATSPGTAYVCGVIERDATGAALANNCVPAPTDVPADENQSGTIFVNLPDACKGRFSRIVIHDADSKAPRVTVRCAPEEKPVVITPP